MMGTASWTVVAAGSRLQAALVSADSRVLWWKVLAARSEEDAEATAVDLSRAVAITASVMSMASAPPSPESQERTLPPDNKDTNTEIVVVILQKSKYQMYH